MRNPKTIARALIAAAAVLCAASAGAQEVKHYRFAHDQQLNSGYSVAYDIFSAKLKELSKGTMLVDQYPGAQLGQESQLLQLVKAGDLEFAIVSSDAGGLLLRKGSAASFKREPGARNDDLNIACGDMGNLWRRLPFTMNRGALGSASCSSDSSPSSRNRSATVAPGLALRDWPFTMICNSASGGIRHSRDTQFLRRTQRLDA